MGVWQSNPVRVVGVITAVLQGVFPILAASGHPVSVQMQSAITGFVILLAGEVTRSQVHAPSTVAAMMTAATANP